MEEYQLQLTVFEPPRAYAKGNSISLCVPKDPDVYATCMDMVADSIRDYTTEDELKQGLINFVNDSLENRCHYYLNATMENDGSRLGEQGVHGDVSYHEFDVGDSIRLCDYGRLSTLYRNQDNMKVLDVMLGFAAKEV